MQTGSKKQPAVVDMNLMNWSCFMEKIFWFDPVFSSPEHFVLKVSYCDQSVPVVRRASCGLGHQQFALKAYSSYTPRPINSKLGRKHWGDS